MKILMNGDIYIKIQPDVIEPDKNQIEKLKDKLYELDYEEAQNGITAKTQQIREKFEKCLKKITEEKINYTQIDNFHILKITENGLEMICYNKIGKKESNKCDIKKIKEKYVRLLDFLKEAKYIGKEFIRTEPLLKDGNKDTSYIKQDPYESTTVLYKTDYAMLVEYKSRHVHYFEMLKPEYFIDNNYTFIGNTQKIYENKKETYMEVIGEIENRYEYYKKYYKNKQTR